MKNPSAKCLSILLALAMLLLTLPEIAAPAHAAPNADVTYSGVVDPIVIDTDCTVLLDGVTIASSGTSGSGITIAAGVTAEICFSGDCTVSGNTGNTSLLSAGIEVRSGARLILSGEEGATLTVTGGKYGAGIGGIGGNDDVIRPRPGEIQIENGTITARGGSNSAGIGGGYHQSGGTVTIKGGNVTAIAGAAGAGIGSGYASSGGGATKIGDYDGGTITITGGTVRAAAGEIDFDTVDALDPDTFTISGGFGAGIGGGYGATSGTILISGGTVLAIGIQGGAGIGSGRGTTKTANYNSTCMPCDITIEGDARVTALAGRESRDGQPPAGGAGIGGGRGFGLEGGSVGTIRIRGQAVVFAHAGAYADGVGTGFSVMKASAGQEEETMKHRAAADTQFGQEICLAEYVAGAPSFGLNPVTVTTGGNGSAAADVVSGEYGKAVTITATPDEHYQFKAWEVVSGGVTVADADDAETTFTMGLEPVSVKANFEKVKHTIAFVNDDGTVLQSGEVDWGDTPVYAGAKPTKAQTERLVFTFTGWTPEIAAVTGDQTYTAVYDSADRLYTVTVVGGSAADGVYHIADDTVAITADPAPAGQEFDVWTSGDGVTFADANAAETTFTMPTNDVTVTANYKDMQQVSTPTFDPAPGTVASGTAVTISCATPGAVIRYTTDGSEPTAASPVCSGPIALDADTVVKAFAAKDGMLDSAVATAAYTVRYRVIVTADGSGSASASPDGGVRGTEVTLSASPDDGWHFQSWEVLSGGVTIENDRFAIGTKDVEIKAIFEADESEIVPDPDPDPDPEPKPDPDPDPGPGPRPPIPVPPVPTEPAAPAETRYEAVDPTAGGTLDSFKRSGVYTAGMFRDADAEGWYAENLRAVVEYGLMLGMDDGTFGVGQPLKVSEALALACRLHNIYYGGSGEFDQTQDALWYQVYVDYAARYGITASGALDPDAAATRSLFAELISAALPDAALAPTDGAKRPPDVSADDAAGPAILRLYAAGILNGTDDAGTFLPGAEIAREQAAAIITRVADPALRDS